MLETVPTRVIFRMEFRNTEDNSVMSGLKNDQLQWSFIDSTLPVTLDYKQCAYTYTTIQLHTQPHKNTYMQTGHVNRKELNKSPYTCLSHSPKNNILLSSPKVQWWETGKHHLRKRFSQHSSKGKKPPREYSDQKILMYLLKSWPTMKCFPMSLWTAPRSTILMLLHTNTRILLHPNSSISKGKWVQIVNGIMKTSYCLRTNQIIFRIRKTEIRAPGWLRA